MAENSSIAWTDNTLNPWWGCSRVSPGCEHCYAESFATRVGHGKRLPTIWGVDGERKPASEQQWKLPIRWNRDAAAAGVRVRVFCASMADVFELAPARNVAANAVMNAARSRLWRTIVETPALDWQILTKRPENIERLAPWRWSSHGAATASPWPANLWLGVTAEDQQRADERIPILLQTGARVKFVSYEPAIGPVDFTKHVRGPDRTAWLKTLGAPPMGGFPGIDWLIIGGESGPGRRPFDLRWAHDAAELCARGRVPVFMKQDSGPKPGERGRLGDALWSLKQFPT